MEEVILRSHPRFLHQPLDRSGQAIRLLVILPNLSKDGLIQCEMWHDTIETSHTCLSYVWGSEEDEQDILVNGRLFRVRSNLWGFLDVARSRYSTTRDVIKDERCGSHTNPWDDPSKTRALEPKVFWIDALCIDQSSIDERNHQVELMGSIYSNAGDVIGWLGHDKAIRRGLRYWINFAARMAFEEKLGFDKQDPHARKYALDVWNEQICRRRTGARDWASLANCDYWQRAWIAQEILLARRFTLLAKDFAMEPTRYREIGLVLPNIHRPSGRDYRWKSPLQLFNSYIETLVGNANVTQSTLIGLIRTLPYRRSEIPRDVIYSLRALATDGHKITVDYDSEPYEFRHELLSILRPSLCICTMFHLAVSCDSLVGNYGDVIDRVIKLPLKPLTVQAGPSEAFDCPICGMHLRKPRQGQQFFCLQALCAATSTAHVTLEHHHGAYYYIRQVLDNEIFIVVVEICDEECQDKSSGITTAVNGGAQSPLYNIYISACHLIQLFRSRYLGHPMIDRAVASAKGSCDNAAEHRGPLSNCLFSTTFTVEVDGIQERLSLPPYFTSPRYATTSW